MIIHLTYNELLSSNCRTVTALLFYLYIFALFMLTYFQIQIMQNKEGVRFADRETHFAKA
ncbi:hypothetical protein CULT_2380004 [[Clostridium] ultunense Esp]|nr:hypothetical protein CULT_2380004 [[Clostridium] ultunense Esp]